MERSYLLRCDLRVQLYLVCRILIARMHGISISSCFELVMWRSFPESRRTRRVSFVISARLQENISAFGDQPDLLKCSFGLVNAGLGAPCVPQTSEVLADAFEKNTVGCQLFTTGCHNIAATNCFFPIYCFFNIIQALFSREKRTEACSDHDIAQFLSNRSYFSFTLSLCDAHTLGSFEEKVCEVCVCETSFVESVWCVQFMSNEIQKYNLQWKIFVSLVQHEDKPR